MYYFGLQNAAISGKMCLRMLAGSITSRGALYYASRDRRQEHPERHLKSFTGILQVDAHGGYNALFKVDRDPGLLTQRLLLGTFTSQVLRTCRHRHNAKRGKNAAPM